MQWMHVVLSRPGFTVFSVSGLVATGARPLATIASPDFAPQTHGNISNRNAKVHVYIGISMYIKDCQSIDEIDEIDEICLPPV